MVREPQAVRLAAFCCSFSFPIVLFVAARKGCPMVGTDTYRRNDDGTYSSEYGHTVSKAPNGSLWVGGAPTGYRDIGFGVQLTPSEWVPSSLQPPAPYKPHTYAPPVQYAYGDRYSGRVSSAAPGWRSTTMTSWPRSRKCHAVLMPMMPAPRTMVFMGRSVREIAFN